MQSQHGDYTDMFRRHTDDARVETVVIDAVDGTLPSASEVDLALITGSPASVVEVEPWVDRLAELSSQMIDRGVPLLGVCYGHQLVAYARGGEVKVNDRGYEIGTADVRLTDAGIDDPLLGSLDPVDRTLQFNAIHGDAVTRAPDSARILAENDNSDVQAFSMGDRTWCVQFHPEISKGAIEMYVDERRAVIERRAAEIGLDPAEAVRIARESIRPTPAGPRLLSRFVDLALERLG